MNWISSQSEQELRISMNKLGEEDMGIHWDTSQCSETHFLYRSVLICTTRLTGPKHMLGL